jgi:hypothetical protein
MKEALNRETGEKVMVPDDTPVKTIAGVGHCLLSDADKAQIAVDQANFQKERAEYLANQKYLDDRKKARPSIEEQLEMQHQDALNGTTTWKDMMDETARRFPKPEGERL